MATDKPKFSVILEPEINTLVEKYWHQNELKNKSKATARLIEIGLITEGLLKEKTE